MLEKRVTIIVPVYNTEKYLSRCLESIIQQTYKNLEILLINDGSTDESLNICRKYEKIDERISIINNINSGVSKSRNDGLEVATGEYIYFSDSDDFLERNAIEYMVNFCKEQVSDLLICGYYEDIDGKREKKEWENRFISIEDAQNSILDPNGVGGYLWNKFFKKDIIDAYHIRFDEKISIWEDLLFVMKYVSKCESIHILNKSIYTYCRRNDSAVSYHWFNKRLLTQIDAIETIKKDISMTDKVEKLLNMRLVCCCLGIIRSMSLSSQYDKHVINKCNRYIKSLRKEVFGQLSKTDKISIILLEINPNIFVKIYSIWHKKKNRGDKGCRKH